MRVIPGVKRVEFDFNIMIVEFDEEVATAQAVIEKAALASSREPEVL